MIWVRFCVEQTKEPTVSKVVGPMASPPGRGFGFEFQSHSLEMMPKRFPNCCSSFLNCAPSPMALANVRAITLTTHVSRDQKYWFVGEGWEGGGTRRQLFSKRVVTSRRPSQKRLRLLATCRLPDFLTGVEWTQKVLEPSRPFWC